jgi:hypothetical protein
MFPRKPLLFACPCCHSSKRTRHAKENTTNRRRFITTFGSKIADMINIPKGLESSQPDLLQGVITAPMDMEIITSALLAAPGTCPQYDSTH